MKRIFKLIIKNRKKIILILAIFVIIILLLFRLGIITPSKSSMISYFNRNKNSFNRVIDYVYSQHKENIDYTHIDYNYMEFSDTIKSKNKDIIYLLYLGRFERIVDHSKWNFELHKFSDKIQVSFYVNNLYVDVGEPIAIVYSDEELSVECEGEWEKEYEVTYKHIENNWYLEYRSY